MSNWWRNRSSVQASVTCQPSPTSSLLSPRIPLCEALRLSTSAAEPLDGGKPSGSSHDDVSLAAIGSGPSKRPRDCLAAAQLPAIGYVHRKTTKAEVDPRRSVRRAARLCHPCEAISTTLVTVAMLVGRARVQAASRRGRAPARARVGASPGRRVTAYATAPTPPALPTLLRPPVGSASPGSKSRSKFLRRGKDVLWRGEKGQPFNEIG